MRSYVWLFLLIHASTSISNISQYSCGSLIGDPRFCLNFTGQRLRYLPSGFNITNRLILKDNDIQIIKLDDFLNQALLRYLDLRENRITYLEVKSLDRMSELDRVLLSKNPYNCDFLVCPLKSWILKRSAIVADAMEVKCHSPVSLAGTEVINIPDSICRNNTNNNSNGFQINTGTVFLIWIVVPIAITFLVGMYILVNGNNRFGRAIREEMNSMRRRLLRRRHRGQHHRNPVDLVVDEGEEGEADRAGSIGNALSRMNINIPDRVRSLTFSHDEFSSEGMRQPTTQQTPGAASNATF